ncbi:hypothetical protein PR048_003536 [Dryococelus australis]|uniref:Uncharacterized protein n=1 Tax=Dryococelus australis TaxID=614101 RepID=A0ABQ9IPB5_9NEOP|nr:hypothetical protein PR048_003536 [Dryococelus australis]
MWYNCVERPSTGIAICDYYLLVDRLQVRPSFRLSNGHCSSFKIVVTGPTKHFALCEALMLVTGDICDISKVDICDADTCDIRFGFRRRRSLVYACGNRGGRCRWPAGFLEDLPFLPLLRSGAAPYSTHFILIGSRDLDVTIRPNLFTHLTPIAGSIQEDLANRYPYPEMPPYTQKGDNSVQGWCQHVAEYIIEDGRRVLEGFECCMKPGLKFISSLVFTRVSYTSVFTWPQEVDIQRRWVGLARRPDSGTTYCASNGAEQNNLQPTHLGSPAGGLMLTSTEATSQHCVLPYLGPALLRLADLETPDRQVGGSLYRMIRRSINWISMTSIVFFLAQDNSSPCAMRKPTEHAVRNGCNCGLNSVVPVRQRAMFCDLLSGAPLQRIITCAEIWTANRPGHRVSVKICRSNEHCARTLPAECAASRSPRLCLESQQPDEHDTTDRCDVAARRNFSDTMESRNRMQFCKVVGAAILSDWRHSDLAFHWLPLRFRRVGVVVPALLKTCRRPTCMHTDSERRDLGGSYHRGSWEPMRVKRSEVGAAPECKDGGTGDLRENPPTSGIALHDFPTRENPGVTPPLIEPDICGAAVAERLDCSPPTKANRFRFWELYWEGFLRDLPFHPPLHSSSVPYLPRRLSRHRSNFPFGVHRPTEGAETAGRKDTRSAPHAKYGYPRTAASMWYSRHKAAGPFTAVGSIPGGQAIHDKVRTFEVDFRKKALLLPAHILTAALCDMRPVKLVTMTGKFDVKSAHFIMPIAQPIGYLAEHAPIRERARSHQKKRQAIWYLCIYLLCGIEAAVARKRFRSIAGVMAEAACIMRGTRRPLHGSSTPNQSPRKHSIQKIHEQQLYIITVPLITRSERSLTSILDKLWQQKVLLAFPSRLLSHGAFGEL